MTPFEIYKQGKKARADGLPVEANPYPYPSASYTYWWDGWHD